MLSGRYPGFRGIEDLASDLQGRTYVANTTADMVSVVAGAPSEVVGAIDVPAPSRIAVSGDTLFVISNGRIITRSASTFIPGGTVTIMPSVTLSASDLNIQVSGSFSRVPAHNTIYYNGARFLMDGAAEYNFTGNEQTLTYAIAVPHRRWACMCRWINSPAG